MRPILAPDARPDLMRGPAPTFSILIATYEAAASIAESVESALAQTVPAHEVIVIDDGSTDGTQNALARYLGRVTYMRQENRGKAAAINVGARQATGDFVSILDADDVYAEERIEALTELAIQRPDLDILMTDAFFESEGELVGRFFDSTPFAVTDQKVAIFERCFIAWPALRRTTLIAIGGFDESPLVSPAEDWECWIRLLHSGCSAGAVAEPLMRYRIGDQSLTADRVNALRSRVHILELASRLDLSAEERSALGRFLARRRPRLLLAEAEKALREYRGDARRRSLAVAAAPGMPLRVRVKAVAASIAPRVAARRLCAIEAKTGNTRIKRAIPGQK